jgi:phosphoglycolate phosphatase-like HAD superfamily hydrolase
MSETENRSEKAPLSITDVFADADNNIWDWVGMQAPGIEAMADLLSRHLDTPIEEVRASMGRVYAQAGCMDFKELVQFMDIVLDKVVLRTMEGYKDPLAGAIQAAIELTGLVQATHKKFTSVRERNFKLYPHIPEVFKALHENRVNIHILTDAPVHKAITRIKMMGLEPYVKTMFAQPRLKFDSNLHFKENGNNDKYAHIHRILSQIVDHIPEHYEPELKTMGHYDVPFKVVVLHDQKKPKIELAGLIKTTRERIADFAATWGDSSKSDMGLAANNGCVGFFSEYGKVTPENAKVFDLYGNPKGPSRDMDSDDPVIKGIREAMGDKLVRIKDPIQILDHLGIERPKI